MANEAPNWLMKVKKQTTELFFSIINSGFFDLLARVFIAAGAIAGLDTVWLPGADTAAHMVTIVLFMWVLRPSFNKMRMLWVRMHNNCEHEQVEIIEEYPTYSILRCMNCGEEIVSEKEQIKRNKIINSEEVTIKGKKMLKLNARGYRIRHYSINTPLKEAIKLYEAKMSEEDKR